jgi:SAM-dependent methyltransferase
MYDHPGLQYARVRRADDRVAAQIRAALGAGAGGRVVNVGAGAGSYEPRDLRVTAVEPSAVMIAERPRDAAPAVRAVAEDLPFAERTFHSGMAVLTVHHWSDRLKGLRELRRVVRGPIAVMSWDAVVFDGYWMVDEYVPASRTLDRDLPRPEEIAAILGGGTVDVVPVPWDCTDGFYAAWWRRPEAYLDPDVRSAISGLARLDPRDVQQGISRLARDLASGEWARRHRDLLDLECYDAGYRLIVAGAT